MVVIAREAAEFQADDDDTWTAHWIVLDAGAQAARVRRQASAQTAAVCEAAEREAAKIRRQASMQAAAIHEAAEREAAQLRAMVAALSAGAGDVAHADGGATTIAAPVRPAAKPVPRGRPGTKGRQAQAMRKVAAGVVLLSLVGAGSGLAEIKLHGFAFFLFRNTGAGAGNSRDLEEDQGPGQPDAPKPQHRVATQGTRGTPSPTGSVAHGQ